MKSFDAYLERQTEEYLGEDIPEDFCLDIAEEIAEECEDQAEYEGKSTDLKDKVKAEALKLIADYIRTADFVEKAYQKV